MFQKEPFEMNVSKMKGMQIYRATATKYTKQILYDIKNINYFST
jgi:hypothetical protein